MQFENVDVEIFFKKGSLIGESSNLQRIFWGFSKLPTISAFLKSMEKWNHRKNSKTCYQLKFWPPRIQVRLLRNADEQYLRKQYRKTLTFSAVPALNEKLKKCQASKEGKKSTLLWKLHLKKCVLWHLLLLIIGCFNAFSAERRSRQC